MKINLSLLACGTVLLSVCNVFSYDDSIFCGRERLYGNSPIHNAVISNDVSLLKSLLDNRCDIEKRNNYGSTAFLLAVERDNITMAKILISRGAEVDVLDFGAKTSLYYATLNENEGMVDLLLCNKASVCVPMEGTDTPLHIACKHGNMHIVKRLIEHGANMYSVGMHEMKPIDYAIVYKRKNVFDHFLSLGYKPMKPSLHIAALHGNINATWNLLLLNRIDVNSLYKGNTALYLASWHGFKEIVEMLIEYGADIDLKSSDGETPLMIATIFCKTEVVRILLKKGANTSLKNNFQKSVYEYNTTQEIKNILTTYK